MINKNIDAEKLAKWIEGGCLNESLAHMAFGHDALKEAAAHIRTLAEAEQFLEDCIVPGADTEWYKATSRVGQKGLELIRGPNHTQERDQPDSQVQEFSKAVADLAITVGKLTYKISLLESKVYGLPDDVELKYKGER